MSVEPSHSDVLIVGAGISGIGAAYYLKTRCRDRSFAIIEGRSNIGGTWDLFRYPGIRSDSDMYTLGYQFKPWKDEKAIADGSSILRYLRETVDEYGLGDHISFNRRAKSAQWNSSTRTWTVTSTNTETGDVDIRTCSLLFMCSGYYSYKGGYSPEFVGDENFTGPIVHPQQWREDLDYQGARVVVIGSGATAVTLVPALAPDAAHVTMLQRSPSYMAILPSVDPIAQRIRKLLPERIAHRAIRWKNVRFVDKVYRQSRSHPEMVKRRLLAQVQSALGPNQNVAPDFMPSYNPWDQRLCLVPDGDLFGAITSGKASVVTDHIERFTETGILLRSGAHLDADIIVTATGLQMVTLGEMEFVVDGDPVDFADTWTYKGIAYSNIPNLFSSFGYINASWTLRVDITFQYVCRILNHMAEIGADRFTPRLRPSDHSMVARPWIDDFSSGYMQRAMPMLPKQGDRAPWINPQNYLLEKRSFRRARIDDGVLEFVGSETRA